MKIEIIDLWFQGTPGAIAAFLIEGPEGAILIETGPESTRETLLAGLERHGYGAGDLAAVFVTHIHLDHAGAAGWFGSEGVPVYVHPKGRKHLVDPSRLVESARMVYGDAFDELWVGMPATPEEQVIEFADGETVSCAGLTIEAVATPGHAFHHHAFVVDGTTVFAGDAAGARLDDSGYLSVTSAPPQFHLEHTLASLERLENLDGSRLFVTHFGEIRDPGTHLENYASQVRANAAFVRDRLREGMDPDSLQIAYQAFQMEQAFQCHTPREIWDRIQLVNGTAMCAEGIRIYWEKFADDAA